MEKLASQMLEQAKNFIEANPQIVKNTLLAGGLGAAAGAMMSSPAEDEDEPASVRLKRRLKNALIGGAVLGGTGALLSNAAYNFGTAKLQRQPTPEEKFIEAQGNVSDMVAHPLTLTAGAAGGAGFGAVRDYNRHQEKANTIIQNISKKTSAIEQRLQERLAKATNPAEIKVLQDALRGLTGPAENMGTEGLSKWLYANKDAIVSGKSSGLGDIMTALENGFGFDDKKELAKSLRELNISATKAGLETGTSIPKRLWRNISPKFWGNWRTALGLAAVPAALGAAGWLTDPE